MTILAQLAVDVRVDPAGAWGRAEVDARIAPPWDGVFDPDVFDPAVFGGSIDYAHQVVLDVTVRDDLLQAVAPAAAVPQVVTPWRLLVDGVEVDRRHLIGSLRVEEDAAGVVTWQATLLRGDDGRGEPLGRPVSLRGVPGGDGLVEIRAGFLLPGRTGLLEVPLVVDGIVDNTEGEPRQRTINGGGPRERLRQKEATYTAPPGHGQTSGTVVRRILASAGLALDDGGREGTRRYKEVSVIDEDPLAAADRILAPELKRVYVDPRTGETGIRDYGAAPEARVEGVIRDRDVWAVGGELKDSAAADQVTAITLTGSKQIIRELGDGDGCPRETTLQISINSSVFAPRVATHTNGAGSILPQEEPKLQRESVLLYWRTKACETVVFEREVTLSWRNPEQARYEVAFDGALSNYVYPVNGPFFYTNPATDAAAPAYKWPAERWGVSRHVTRERRFDPETGALRRVTERVMGYHVQQTPLKASLNPSPDWSAIDYESNLATTADGRGVGPPLLDPKEARWTGDGGLPPYPPNPDALTVWGTQSTSPGSELARTVTLYETTEDGRFLTAEEVIHYERTVRLGHGKYLWAAGESPDQTETLRIVGRERVEYIPTDDTHSRISRRWDEWDQEAEGVSEHGLPGHLPAAERRQDVVPPPETYDDDSEAANAAAASRLETAEIRGRATAPAGLDWLTREVTRTAPSEAETVEDLMRMARWAIRESSTLGLRVPVMFNPLIRPGQRWLVQLASLGWYYDLVVDRVRHQQESDGRTWTQVEGEHHVL